MSGNPGAGVMRCEPAVNADSVSVFRAAVGKEITALSLGDDGALHFTFADGTKMALVSEGQSCRESRCMRTDDDLAAFVGATLCAAETRAGGEYGQVHEDAFLVIKTSKGSFTLASRNEHNGYYGGFAIRARAE